MYNLVRGIYGSLCNAALQNTMLSGLPLRNHKDLANLEKISFSPYVIHSTVFINVFIMDSILRFYH